MNPIRKKRIYSILFVFLFSVSGISLILYSLNSNLDYIKGETLAIKLYFSENLNEGEEIEFDDIKTVITINKV